MGRRYGEILLGMILVLIGFASLEGGMSALLLLSLLGFFLLSRQFNITRQAGLGEARRAVEPPPHRAADQDAAPQEESSASIFAHARRAAAAAGIALDSAAVYPVDVGLMGFSADDDPIIYRTSAIPDDMDYIQPYVQLHVPMRVRGAITFEIRDSAGQRLFLHSTEQTLRRGDNLITPAARLPIHDALDLDAGWELTVRANDVPIAIHRFGWRKTGSRLIRQHLQEDGEISAELRALVAQSRLGRLSLDELLTDQDTLVPLPADHDARSQRASRAAN